MLPFVDRVENSGAPYSRHPAATVETSPLLIGDTIYFGASDGIIYGIDKESGQTTWKHKTGAPLFSKAIKNDKPINRDLLNTLRISSI